MKLRGILDEVRGRARGGFGRLRLNAWAMVQTAVAASLAYSIAVFVLGHQRPFFAAIAAVVSLGVVLGQRRRRAVELVFGVAFGLTVADLLVIFIGTGTLQISVVVVLAMAAAIFSGGGTLLVNQAAISAILVVVLQPPDAVFQPTRFLDALVGGAVALAINYVFPVNPERLVERAAGPVFEELVRILKEVSDALAEGDEAMADAALVRAREIDDRVRSFNEALAAGHETARLSPMRRRSLKHLDLYARAGGRIELAVINTRVLARGAANAVRRGDPVTQPLLDALHDLARAVEALARFLEETGPADEAREYALKAAGEATELLKERHDLGISVLVGQIRAAATDLLRSTGMDQASALQALEDAAGRASEV